MEPLIPDRCVDSVDIGQQAQCLCKYLTDEGLLTDCKYAVVQFNEAFSDYCLPLMLENKEDAFCHDFAGRPSIFPEFDSLPEGIRTLLVDDNHLGAMGYAPPQAKEVYSAIRGGRKFPSAPNRKTSSQPELTAEKLGIAFHLLPPDLLWTNSELTAPHKFYGRFGGRVDAYVYFEKGIYISGGIEYLFGMGDSVNLHHIDAVLSGGYFLRLAKEIGLKFVGGVKLGYGFSAKEFVRMSHFDLAAGGGIKALVSFDKWGLTFGPEYWRTLSYQKDADPPLNSLLFAIGAEINLKYNGL